MIVLKKWYNAECSEGKITKSQDTLDVTNFPSAPARKSSGKCGKKTAINRIDPIEAYSFEIAKDPLGKLKMGMIRIPRNQEHAHLLF